MLAADTLAPNFNLIGDERHVAVAVSGGPDSMALLLLMKAWALTNHRQITALHFDHGLRLESSAEATQVQAWCTAKQISFRSAKWSGDKPKTAIQAKARDARYEALTLMCRQIGAGVLLTGHTANDQAETYLMRQKRSSTAHALSGIWPERILNGVRIVRPLLCCTKISLNSYLVEHQQAWIEDPSNQNARFERVRTRNNLASQDVQELANLSAIALQSHQSAERQTKQWSASLKCDAFGVVIFAAAEFLTLPTGVQDLALITVMERAGRVTEVSGLERRKLLYWMTFGLSRNRTLNGLVFQRAASHFKVFREFGRIDPAPQVVPELGEFFWDHRFLISAPHGSTIVPLGSVQGIARRHDIAAAVQKTLPAVHLANDGLCVPHLGQGQGAEIKNKL